MSPESARPVLGGPSIAGVQRSMSFPPRGLVRRPNAFSVAKPHALGLAHGAAPTAHERLRAAPQ